MHALPNAPVKAMTELGEEKRCVACGDYWPADAEFFDLKMSSRDGLSQRCIACIKGKVWGLQKLYPDPSRGLRHDAAPHAGMFTQMIAKIVMR